MGAWGNQPWDNDRAADWFGDLFERTQLAPIVEKTLLLDPADFPDEIRAAACALVFWGRVYVWPVKELQRHLALAADQLEAVSRLEEITESLKLAKQIQSEVQELRSRLAQYERRP